MTDKEFLVRDYMHETATINQNGATFKDVLLRMIEAKRNGIFVVDDQNHVVGVISAWDLIERVVPDYLEADRHLAAFESGDVLSDRVKAVANDPITQLTTTPVHSVHEDSTIMEVATMLSEHRLRQLPVVNDTGILVGCINRTDVKTIMAEILNLQTS
ncbi:MAG TPA: CBS domain-containing protein [Patescibacteria group bacterium]|nr:CBS domain-containing protein [Patescibacteria group bacterium]